HAERLGDLRDARAELAEADHAESLPVEIDADRGLPWLARLHTRVLVADPAGEPEHQPDRDAGRGIAHAGRPAHHHIALLGGGEIERRVAGPGGDQELELGKPLDHGPRKRRALAHAADDLEIGQRADDLVRPAERRVEYLDLDVLRDR